MGALVLAFALSTTPASASVVTAFTAQTDLGVVTLGARAAGNSVFGNDGGPNGGLNASLLAPGGVLPGFPTFFGALAGGALVDSKSSAAIGPLSVFQNAQVVNGLQFGNAASTAGGGITVAPFQGSGPGGGVFWAPYTLSDGNHAGTASAIYSAGAVLLHNVSGQNFIANVPGIFVLGVSGFIPNGSFVTGSIRGDISGVTQDVEFAASGAGAPFDFVHDNTGIDELDEVSVAGGHLFEAFGVSVVGPFTITAAGPLSFISGDATVSLLSDAMAQIEFAPLPQNLTDELDQYLINHGFILDGFSVQAGAQMPEPGTLSLVCAGLVALGGVAWRRRQRSAFC